MKQLLVATDFSTRSDRAIRRASLLARDRGIPLHLLHVVDDDQPRRILNAEQEAAFELLSELAQTIRNVDGVSCLPHVVLGDAFEGIIKAADDFAVDLIVIGPHRRNILKDVFMGTTAERTIRESRRPVLMANAMPSRSYRHILVATDFSACAGDALRAVAALGFDKKAAITVAHVFDAVASALAARSSLLDDEFKAHLADAEAEAARELGTFLADAGFTPMRRELRRNESSIGRTICEMARGAEADLIVVGTHGRSGVARLLLGSVAADVLQVATCDVLAVPPRAESAV
jgi:nucleotide-binding universal stress UspA family protein